MPLSVRSTTFLAMRWSDSRSDKKIPLPQEKSSRQFSCPILLFLAIALVFLPTALHAADLFRYQGPYTRASSGAYLTESRSGEAALQNPANLTYGGSTKYGDIGLANWKYTITPAESPDSKGSMSSPILPLVSLGGSLRASRSLVFGATLIPLGFPGVKSNIKMMPEHTAGVFQQVNVQAEQTSYKAAFGVGYKVSHRFRLGLCAVLQNDSRKMTVLSPDSGDPSMIETQQSTYLIPRLGFAGRLGSFLNWAFAFEPATTSSYKVNSTIVSTGEGTTQTGHEYHAQTYEIGASFTLIPGITPYGQYVREQWIPGSMKSTPPGDLMGGNNVPTHFLNTNNFVGGIKIRTKKQQALYLGISSYQTNKGDGIKGDNGAPLFAGAEPGDFESLNRIHYTVGYKMSIHDNILLGYLSYISAVKLTAEDSPAPGYYDLKVILFGFGLVMN